MGQQHHPTVWLHSGTESPGGCGHCHAPVDGPACEGHLGGEPCLSPELHGAATALRRVIDSLRAVRTADAGDNIVDLHLVKSLRIADGEAELTVTFPRGCGSASEIAEAAFQAMRRLLPDTDIYVRHAA
jgi:metal-sulfur cluster biosynthetic enzyme